MTDERLQALEDWARAWSRAETQAGRVALELVAEVRRLREGQSLGAADAPVPPFRGILDGITAADLVTAATLARLEAERAGVRTLIAFAAAEGLCAGRRGRSSAAWRGEGHEHAERSRRRLPRADR